MKDKTTIKLSELCYYLFFGILLFAKAVGLYDGQVIFKICLVFAAAFAFIKLVLTAYNKWEFLVEILLLLLACVVYINSGEKSALVFLMMMIAFKNVPLDKLMQFGLYVFGAGFILLIIMSTVGLVDPHILVHHKFGLNLIREGLGYSHPNVLHVSYAVLTAFVLYTLGNEKNKIKIYVLALIGNIVVFLYSLSYTGFLLVLFFLLFHAYFSCRKHFTRIEKMMIYAIYPICLVFSLIVPLILDPDSTFFQLINKALNRRFYASRLYLLENGVTLFGKRIVASHTYALDSSYVTLFLYGGVILFVLVSAGYIYAIRMAEKNQDAKGLSILLSFSIAGVIEPFLFNLSFKNLSLLIVAYYLFQLVQGKEDINLLSKYDREITLPVVVRDEKMEPDRCKVRKVQAVMISIAIFVGIFSYIMTKMPDAILVNEKYCDLEEEMPIDHLDELLQHENIDFYGYTEGEDMYLLDGKTLAFHKVRESIKVGYLVFILLNVVWSYVDGKNKKRNNYRK